MKKSSIHSNSFSPCRNEFDLSFDLLKRAQAQDCRLCPNFQSNKSEFGKLYANKQPDIKIKEQERSKNQAMTFPVAILLHIQKLKLDTMQPLIYG